MLKMMMRKMVVIPHGKSKIHPKENRLYVVQIWCPEIQFSNQQEIMEDILKSININGDRNKLN